MLAEKSQDNYGPLHSNSKKVKRKKLKKKRPRKKNNTKSIFLALVFLMGALLVLSRYVEINNVRMEITDLEKRSEELEKEKVNLEAKLEGIKSSERISEDAMVNLGMHYPRKDQILYVSVARPKAKKAGKKSNSFLGGILGERIKKGI